MASVRRHALRRQRQEDSCAFKASLIYKVYKMSVQPRLHK